MSYSRRTSTLTFNGRLPVHPPKIGFILWWVIAIALLVSLTLSLSESTSRVARAAQTVPTQVITSSFYGHIGSEEITGVAQFSNGDIIIVGNSDTPTFPGATAIGGAGSPCSSTNPGGFIARLNPNGQAFIWQRYFNCGVAAPRRVVLDASDNIYIAGIAYSGFSSLVSGTCDTTINGSSDPFVAKLSPTTGNMVWASFRQGEAYLDNVQLGLASGGRPLLGGKNGATAFLTRFGSDGSCDAGFDTSVSDPLNGGAQTWLAELVVKPADDTVYAIGYHQRETNLKVPFLVSFNSSGAVRWRDYNSAAVPSGLRADSVGRALSLDADGNLLAAFSTDGGNTILYKDPQNLNSLDIPQLNGAYQPGYGLANGSATSSFIGRYSAATGNILDATFFHATLTNGRTNTTRVAAVRADSANRVYIVGETACCLPLTSDAYRSSYISGEGFFTLLNPQMSGPLLYSSYFGSDGDAGTDKINALALKGDRVILGGSSGFPGFVSLNPLQLNFGRGPKDAQLVIIAPPYELDLFLATAPQIIGAEQPSAPIKVELRNSLTGLPFGAANNINLTLTSSSPGGGFSLTSGGSYSSSLNILLAAGQSSVSFFYKDSNSGQPTITITPSITSGLSTLTQVETIVKLTVSPNNLAFRANRLGQVPPAKSVIISLPGANSAVNGWALVGGSLNYGPGASGWLNLGAITGGPSTPQTATIGIANLPAGIGTYTASFSLRDTSYNSQATVNLTLEVREVKLVILTNPQIISQNADSGAITLELEDSLDFRPVKLSDPLSLTLSSSSLTGVFSATPGGSPVTTATISSGSSRTAFYYRDSTIGTPTLTATPGSGLDPVSTTIAVVNSTDCPPASSTIVNNSADGPSADLCQVTFRKALGRSNNNITFAAGINIVIPETALPNLIGKKVNDQPCSPPKIRLDGLSITASGVSGLILGNGNQLYNLAIYGFSGYGVKVIGPGNILKCNYIGTSNNLLAQPNGLGAIQMLVGGNAQFLGNVGNIIWQKLPEQ